MEKVKKARCVDITTPEISAIPYRIGFFVKRLVLVTEEYDSKEEAEARKTRIIERYGEEKILFEDKEYKDEK